MPPHKIAF